MKADPRITEMMIIVYARARCTSIPRSVGTSKQMSVFVKRGNATKRPLIGKPVEAQSKIKLRLRNQEAYEIMRRTGEPAGKGCELIEALMMYIRVQLCCDG